MAHSTVNLSQLDVASRSVPPLSLARITLDRHTLNLVSMHACITVRMHHQRSDAATGDYHWASADLLKHHPRVSQQLSRCCL